MHILDIKRKNLESGWSDWTWQLRHAVRDIDALIECLGLDPAMGEALRPTARRYPIFATPHYLSLIRPGNPHDPILRQILPDRRELTSSESASTDPLGEANDSPVPGLVHRYADRALLLLTNACAVHCRHCMRKRLWDKTRPNREQANRSTALAYIATHDQIREVLLSGGDPLLLPDRVLDDLLQRLHRIPHVEIVRIGSRIPVVLPQRLTQPFCHLLGRHGPVWLATHFNHVAELTPESAAAIANLLTAGIPTVNQTVLLKGINDTVEALRDLCRGLLRQRIKPYYLFHGDPVRGTRHFRTGLDHALTLVEGLRHSLSGLAQPAFAFDLPDGEGKIRLEPDSRQGLSPEGLPLFCSRRGNIVPYDDDATRKEEQPQA